MSELVEKTFNSILKYIRDNHLRPGDRLPSERALGEMLSVGRPVIREATRVLSVMNVIEIRKQGGMFVAELDDDSQLESFRLYVQMGQISLKEVLEARLIIEVECAGLAAVNITDEQLDRITEILSSVSVDDAENFAEADKQLHKAIYTSTGNKAMQLLAGTISKWSIISRSFSNSFIEVREVVHKDHENIVHALRSRDVAASKEAMRQHLMHLNQINAVHDMMQVQLSSLIGNNTGTGSSSESQSFSDVPLSAFERK